MCVCVRLKCIESWEGIISVQELLVTDAHTHIYS